MSPTGCSFLGETQASIVHTRSLDCKKNIEMMNAENGHWHFCVYVIYEHRCDRACKRCFHPLLKSVFVCGIDAGRRMSQQWCLSPASLESIPLPPGILM